MKDPLPENLAKERDQSDYKDLSRSQALNHLETEKTKSGPDHQILDFITKRFWSWIYYYLKSRFGRNHPYQTYSAGDTGIYWLHQTGKSEPVSIGIVADWATNTLESIHIARQMADHNPAYTIHIGDTYFVGAPHEVAANFILPDSPWVRGSKGSFALLGNHEMYAQGTAYFDHLLPTLGVKEAGAKGYSGQKAAFFCLENEYWRILCLDTGFHSTGKLPVAELVFPPDCRFDEKLMDWLRDTVQLGKSDDRRGLVIMTHHQYITGFRSESEYQKPASQLAELIGTDRPVLWIWGHEHKFSAFSKFQSADGVTAYGRCIGHGGMPVELKDKSFQRSGKKKGGAKLVFVDDRKRKGTEKYPLGHNGYAILKIENEQLRLCYYDESDLLLEEVWEANQYGEIKGVRVTPHPDFKVKSADKTWNDMIN